MVSNQAGLDLLEEVIGDVGEVGDVENEISPLASA